MDHRRKNGSGIYLKKTENYNIVSPIITILGDETRQEIPIALIETGRIVEILFGEKKRDSCFALSQHL